MPDAIHLHWQHVFFRGPNWPAVIASTVVFWVQLLLLRLLGVRVIWTIHNIVNHEQLYVKWELFSCRVLARIVHRLVVHCETAKREVSEVYKIRQNKIEVIPHGTISGWYTDWPPISKREAREKLGLEMEKTIFLFFGYVRRYKGVDILLDAFKRLNDPDVRLVVMGKVRPESLLVEISGKADRDERVRTYFEYVSDESLAAYICACDFVTLPYRKSLTSGASSLAAVYGRPVIASRLGCMNELPEDSALLYDPNDADALYECLCKARNISSEKMGRIAHLYDAQFQWPDIARRTVQLYK